MRVEIGRDIVTSLAFVTFGIYQSAVAIAIIAALARTAYTAEKTSFLLFGRFFIMSVSITMLAVHIGLLQGWGHDTVVIVSAVSAFMSREILEALLASKGVILKRIMEVFNAK